MTFRIDVFKGAEAAPYIRTLAEMRLKTFCEFPYLYVGKIEDDLIYTQIFSATPQGMLVVAFQGDTIVGIRSGVPVRDQAKPLDEKRCQQLEKHGIKAKEYYYCGEIIVDLAFRKRGIAGQLMTKFIEEAKAMGFPGLIAITSIRPNDHPLRPQNYFEAGIFLNKYGFEKSSVVFTARWPTQQPDGTVKKEKNELACWIKEMGRKI